MTYKSIVTLLDNSEQCEKWTAYAAGLAIEHKARLVGIAPREIARSLYVGDFMSANSMWLTDLQDRIDTDARQAVAAFSDVCAQHGLRDTESRVVDGAPVETMRRESLFSDLIVLGQELPGKEPATGIAGMVESLLLTTGRPILVVPALGEYKPVADESVLVAWRASKESSLAVRQSLPVLSRAKTVEVVEVLDKADIQSASARDQLVRYLQLHDVEATQHELVSTKDAGNTLLSYACDAGAGLMVMGGYGHARLKEWALGGVTKTILDTMTLPVLMAH